MSVYKLQGREFVKLIASDDLLAFLLKRVTCDLMMALILSSTRFSVTNWNAFYRLYFTSFLQPTTFSLLVMSVLIENASDPTVSATKHYFGSRIISQSL